MSSGFCSRLHIDQKYPRVLATVACHILGKTPGGYPPAAAGRLPSEAELARAITQSWRRETSDDPQGWSCNNPAWGQCAVTALIVQDFFGGDLLWTNINLTPHYWNLLPNGRELDLTKGQFKNVAISGTAVGTERQYILSFSETRRNYRRLRKSVFAELHAQGEAFSKGILSCRRLEKASPSNGQRLPCFIPKAER